jgi:hypothetical protein
MNRSLPGFGHVSTVLCPPIVPRRPPTNSVSVTARCRRSNRTASADDACMCRPLPWRASGGLGSPPRVSVNGRPCGEPRATRRSRMRRASTSWNGQDQVRKRAETEPRAGEHASEPLPMNVRRPAVHRVATRPREWPRGAERRDRGARCGYLSWRDLLLRVGGSAHIRRAFEASRARCTARHRRPEPADGARARAVCARDSPART